MKVHVIYQGPNATFNLDGVTLEKGKRVEGDFRTDLLLWSRRHGVKVVKNLEPDPEPEDKPPQDGSTFDAIELGKRPMTVLQDMARGLKIHAFMGMNKPNLIEAILVAANEPGPVPKPAGGEKKPE